jgi:hypothetical protein
MILYTILVKLLKYDINIILYLFLLKWIFTKIKTKIFLLKLLVCNKFKIFHFKSFEADMYDSSFKYF